jgi:hypothetical protein
MKRNMIFFPFFSFALKREIEMGQNSLFLEKRMVLTWLTRTPRQLSLFRVCASAFQEKEKYKTVHP